MPEWLALGRQLFVFLFALRCCAQSDERKGTRWALKVRHRPRSHRRCAFIFPTPCLVRAWSPGHTRRKHVGSEWEIIKSSHHPKSGKIEIFSERGICGKLKIFGHHSLNRLLIRVVGGFLTQGRQEGRGSS